MFVDSREVLALIREVADEVINPRFRSLDDHEVGEKNPGDLVTVADHEAEELLTQALLAAYPDAVVLGEEAYAGDPDLMARYVAAEHAFTVDPVDGTKNFVNGSPDHAVMVAETRGGVVVRSWIWQPQHQRSYVAARGEGALLNGAPLVSADRPEDPGAWRGVTSRRSWIGRELPGLRPLELTWICCGVDYPKLIEGEAEFILYGKGMPWDHAPASLIVAEAGGHLGTTEGGPYDPRVVPPGLVAAADRATYDTVLAALR
jgi:fructose-1,6-bisphosphatase/inositol monophosphatase family enzyme